MMYLNIWFVSKWDILKLNCNFKIYHAHTHTYCIYYIYIYICGQFYVGKWWNMMMPWSQLSFRRAPHSSLVEAQLISLGQSWDVDSWGSLSRRPSWSPRAHQDQSCSGISVFNSWDSVGLGPGKTAPDFQVGKKPHWMPLEPLRSGGAVDPMSSQVKQRN